MGQDLPRQLEDARAEMEGCDDSEWANYLEGLVRQWEHLAASQSKPQELDSSRGGSGKADPALWWLGIGAGGGIGAGAPEGSEDTCLTCGKMIPVPNRAYGISPDALCCCCRHDRRPARSASQPKLRGEWVVVPREPTRQLASSLCKCHPSRLDEKKWKWAKQRWNGYIEDALAAAQKEE